MQDSKCRLAPQDYHRFHAPCEGSVRGVHHIPGEFYSVKPVAVNSPIDVYDCNKRAILELDTPQFGEVLYIMIAAVQVGSIKLTAGSGESVKKVRPLTRALPPRHLRDVCSPCLKFGTSSQSSECAFVKHAKRSEKQK